MRSAAKPVLVPTTLWLALLGGICTASAADLPQSSSASNAPIQRRDQSDKLCLVWSDGCVNCIRDGGCSNIGIACQPKEVRCIQRQKAPVE